MFTHRRRHRHRTLSSVAISCCSLGVLLFLTTTNKDRWLCWRGYMASTDYGLNMMVNTPCWHTMVKPQHTIFFLQCSINTCGEYMCMFLVSRKQICNLNKRFPSLIAALYSFWPTDALLRNWTECLFVALLLLLLCRLGATTTTWPRHIHITRSNPPTLIIAHMVGFLRIECSCCPTRTNKHHICVQAKMGNAY